MISSHHENTTNETASVHEIEKRPCPAHVSAVRESLPDIQALTPKAVLQLQRMFGNRAVQGFLSSHMDEKAGSRVLHKALQRQKTPPQDEPARREGASSKPPNVWYFYPGSNPSNAESVQIERYKELAKNPNVPEPHPINDLEDIFMHLGRCAHFYRETHGQNLDPFVSEIHIVGEGGSGHMAFGGYSYDADALKEIKTGRGEPYLKEGARINLEGCSVAKEPKGDAFIYQFGRVFFGSKSGYIKASTCTVYPGVQDPFCIPVTYHYPSMKKTKE